MNWNRYIQKAPGMSLGQCIGTHFLYPRSNPLRMVSRGVRERSIRRGIALQSQEQRARGGVVMVMCERPRANAVLICLEDLKQYFEVLVVHVIDQLGDLFIKKRVSHI